jgi:hypothetical protein
MRAFADPAVVPPLHEDPEAVAAKVGMSTITLCLEYKDVCIINGEQGCVCYQWRTRTCELSMENKNVCVINGEQGRVYYQWRTRTCVLSMENKDVCVINGEQGRVY